MPLPNVPLIHRPAAVVAFAADNYEIQSIDSGDSRDRPGAFTDLRLRAKIVRLFKRLRLG